MENKIVEQLFLMQDLEYKAFHSKLMPTVNPDLIIGVRTPELRRYSKEIFGSDEAEMFLGQLPHKYYEENNLHGFLIENIKDYEECLARVKRFLPYIDNWATCDMMSPKVFGKNKDKLLIEIKQWLESKYVYEIRYGIVMLMRWYLTNEYLDETMELVISVVSDEYYINMAKAWFFATALAVDFERVAKVIEENRLDVWTHNKAIQKAIESRRVGEREKEILRKMKRKNANVKEC